MAKVIPIYKSGDKANITHLLTNICAFFSKIFEKNMPKYLINFIDKYNILFMYQFVFCKSHPANHAIILLVDKINNALYSGMY